MSTQTILRIIMYIPYLVILLLLLQYSVGYVNFFIVMDYIMLN